ncbi:MAG: 16S rRNA (uracil(1498)-N(3))-methyltransferase [Deltaproteobacteria bacterium]|nr:16S rRNA (uracil(1498)-N(3))-methyltransferase [Deltaproteobacteria bacterium]
MRRFYIPQNELQKQKAAIIGPDVRHIQRVLRLSPGDTVLVFDGCGKEFTAKIETFSSDTVYISLLEKQDILREPPISLHVCMGFLKDKKMDDLIRHMTEIGLSSWTPMLSERSVARPSDVRVENRLKRWRLIAIEALKQCGGAILPEIRNPKSFDRIIGENKEYDLGIIFWEKAEALLGEDDIAAFPPGCRVLILLGPEGGFSDEEADAALGAGFIPASLGPRILRAETASISAATLIQYLFYRQKTS